MSGMVTAMAAPIRALLDSVGSGSLPGNGPLAALRTTADGLDRAAGDVGRFGASTAALWASAGADGARQMVDAQRTHLAGLAEDARSVADIADEAAVAVAEAATGSAACSTPSPPPPTPSVRRSRSRPGS